MAQGTGALIGPVLALAALLAPAARAQLPPPDRKWIKDLRKIPPTESAPADGSAGVAPPGAGGRTFATLDDYLAYLRDYAAPMDRPWYREVRPGVYRIETGNLRTGERPGAAPERLFTREDLERRFGFRK